MSKRNLFDIERSYVAPDDTNGLRNADALDLGLGMGSIRDAADHTVDAPTEAAWSSGTQRNDSRPARHAKTRKH